MDTKIPHYQPEVLLRGYELSVGVSRVIYLLLSLLSNLLKFHSNLG